MGSPTVPEVDCQNDLLVAGMEFTRLRTPEKAVHMLELIRGYFLSTGLLKRHDKLIQQMEWPLPEWTGRKYIPWFTWSAKPENWAEGKRVLRLVWPGEYRTANRSRRMYAILLSRECADKWVVYDRIGGYPERTEDEVWLQLTSNELVEMLYPLTDGQFVKDLVDGASKVLAASAQAKLEGVIKDQKMAALFEFLNNLASRP